MFKVYAEIQYGFRAENPEKNGIEQFIPFHSIPGGFSNHSLRFEVDIVRVFFALNKDLPHKHF